MTTAELEARIAELEQQLARRGGPKVVGTSDLELPRSLTYVCAMDWGHAKPGCIGWAALLGEDRIHVVREWKFVGLADEEIAAGWKVRTQELRIAPIYVAGDPSMWIRDGRNVTRGQSRAETLIRAGMPLKKAENDRESGWARLHSFLRVPRNDDGQIVGEPLLTIDATCAYLVRTIPAQRSDKTNAEDVDTKGDDHGVDMLRYLVMSRPMPMPVAAPAQKLHPMLEQFLAGQGRGTVVGAENVRRAHA